ncbi:hypothetical protein QR680_017119 [Steinernema hermaphroditum]|uniref:Formin-binding protein 1-like n=1 Tax=Steinernema hermaphroditum TaxID=289476 RepID=A0AA39HFT5_9BILA|nr:hypothetical protein QR680_017119 [Steinernema hermaphroditum]
MFESSSTWGNLWDQTDIVANHTQKGIDTFEKYGQFVKERASIEEEYATKLRNLVKRNLGKKPKEDDPNQAYTYLTSFHELLREIESYALQRESVAEVLKKEIHPAVVQKCLQLKANRKAHLAELSSIQGQMNTTVDMMCKQQKNYAKAFKDAEAAFVKYDKAEKNMDLSRADLEKAKTNATNRNHACEDAKQNYAHSLETANQAQHEYYTNRLPHVLDALRSVDVERIEETKKAMLRSVQAETDVVNVVQRIYADMQTVITKINPEKDMSTLVEQNKSGYAFPEPFPFEDLGSPSAVTQGDTMSSDGSHSMTLKKGTLSNGSAARNANGRGIPRKPSMHHRLFGGSSSSNKNGESDYGSLPPQQKCRKLQHKIEQLEKEMQTKQQGMNGMTKMQQLYKDNPAMGNASEVESQMATNQKEIDKLATEIERMKKLFREATAELNTPLGGGNEASQRPPSAAHISGRSSSPRVPSSLGGGSGDGRAGTPTSQGNKRTSYSEDSISSEGSSARNSTAPSSTIVVNGTNGAHKANSPPLADNSDLYEECEDVPVLGTCKAIYPFDGGSDGTIVMNEGEEMLLLERDEGDGWTRVRTIATKREGFVPTSYLDCKWYPSG